MKSVQQLVIKGKQVPKHLVGLRSFSLDKDAGLVFNSSVAEIHPSGEYSAVSTSLHINF